MTRKREDGTYLHHSDPQGECSEMQRIAKAQGIKPTPNPSLDEMRKKLSDMATYPPVEPFSRSKWGQAFHESAIVGFRPDSVIVPQGFQMPLPRRQFYGWHDYRKDSFFVTTWPPDSPVRPSLELSSLEEVREFLRRKRGKIMWWPPLPQHLAESA